MKRSIGWLAMGAALLAACGGDDGAEANEPATCTLPDCSAIRPLAAVNQPLSAVGDAGVLSFRPGAAGKGALLFLPVEGEPVLVADAVPRETVAVDAAGSSILYLVPTGAPTPWGDMVGELHRFGVRSGEDRQLLDDARGDHFGACGDWVWSWHGGAASANCGWMSALQLSTGRWFDLGESCDTREVEALAVFSADCTRLATAPGRTGGVGVHLLGTGESARLGSGTGRFVGSPALDRVVVPGSTPGALVLHDLTGGAPRELGTGRALAFSPAGTLLVYEADGRLLLVAEGEPVAIAEGFLRVEALGFAPDERRVAWIELGRDEARRLVVYDRALEQRAVIDEAAFSWNEGPVPAIEPTPLHFAAGGRALLYTRRTAGGIELARWDFATGEAQALGAIDGTPPQVDATGAFAGFLGADGSLRLASLETAESWLVAPAASGALFVGRNLVWAEGASGWIVPLP